MGTLLGLTGLTTLDHFFPDALVTRNGNRFDIASGSFQLSAPFDASGKVGANVPGEMFALADTVRPGGGACNSCLAIRSLDPVVSLRYLDAAREQPGITEPLRNLNVEARFLGLHAAPRSAIFGCRATQDKLVLKAPLVHAQPVESFSESLAWLLDCNAVLANSVKDRCVMTELASAAAHDHIRLHVVLTSSLASSYLFDGVLPWAHVLVAGVDEVSAALGVSFEASLNGALQALRVIADYTRPAMIFLTLGKNGMLVYDYELPEIFHVNLKARCGRQVQALLARDRSALCGCGDAAAGAIFAYLEAGVSAMQGQLGALSRGAAAAVMGCATALRWLGYPRRLIASDFVVRGYSAGEAIRTHWD